MSNASPSGRFVWHELLTSDPQAAGQFYAKVVGWKTESWPKDPSYTMFVAKAGPVAGFMLLPEEAKAMGTPPCWMSYIGTADVDATARQAEQLGGRVLKAPEDIPEVGRFAIVQDPQGATFAVFKSIVGAPVNDTPAIGEFSWHELATTDLGAAFEFYRALFGWEKQEAMDMGPELGVYQMFGMSGVMLGGMYRKLPAMPAPPNWLPYAMVGDSKRAAELAKKSGGQIVNGPMEVPGGGWIAMGIDPQGAAFAVHSAKPVEKAAPAKPAPKVAAAPMKAAAPKKAAKPKAAPKKAAKPKAAPKKVAKPKAAPKKAAKKSVRRKPAKRKAAKRPARKPAKKKAAKKVRKPARGASRSAQRSAKGRARKKK